jgi:tRNA(Arg) A34 adenosine deaminase TadA
MGVDHDHFMGIAIAESHKAEAAGNSPIGSVIVRDGEVIGVGQNRVNSDHDPTAHAEVDAIRDACRKLGTTDLSGALCYTAMEPCPMCCWAIETAGLKGVVMGARHQHLRDISPQDYNDYSVEALLAMTGRKYDVVTGVKVEECVKLRRNWLEAGGGKK